LKFHYRWPALPHKHRRFGCVGIWSTVRQVERLAVRTVPDPGPLSTCLFVHQSVISFCDQILHLSLQSTFVWFKLPPSAQALRVLSVLGTWLILFGSCFLEGFVYAFVGWGSSDQFKTTSQWILGFRVQLAQHVKAPNKVSQYSMLPQYWVMLGLHC
jgi:hypothetical protein